ncbi:hypothetical protein MPSYJ_48740 [Mycolicibacterium psychrotolerans]|uniref:EfeO-type cupredoxin-like domain-containing protein n=1 Tax=Mycolicibacterium psychrotolerans TaxID=216929 RepID=A0A7I7MIQ4_9MYCO|nr:hypothetical protein MPSYJ_48740 [Mycolicibacterium psychrotolerans]
MNKSGSFWAAVCLVATAATACGWASTSGTAGADAATVTIASMHYGPPVTVPPGARIAVTNNDSVEHSVTSDAANAFTVDVDGNQQGAFTAPSAPGEYTFHCKYHPAMHGTLIVK